MASQQSGVDIKNKGGNNLTAPTPQNTPINPAPITSTHNPTMDTISENTDTFDSQDTTSNGLTGAFTGNPALLSMLQGKLGTLVGRSSGYIESLPAPVKRRLNGLKYFQSKHAELENKFQEEVLELEKKYLELYKPLYEKRAKIVTGSYEPTDEEVTLGKKVDEEEDREDEEKEEVDDKDVKGVPGFWLVSLKNHPQIAKTITERDEEALRYLVDVRMAYLDKPGFKLEFEFSENDFFTNKLLTKTYYYQDFAYGGDFVYDHAEGCTLDWKEGKDLTVVVETKKQRQKGTSKSRVVKHTVSSDSFFYFFSPPIIPNEDEEIDEEEAEGLDAKLEADYEMGEEFKDKIIPHAVNYFTGKALQYDDFDDENFDDDYYDEDEDEDDEDDDDDDDDDDDTPANGEKAPECKQS
ncbi:hypothetical protein G6F57_005751 [Rhizopus arrhizus]|uniref:Nucleosome assembly protein n=1 Tax=Rhizopus oryzae TaxID=64495 RepID=A0A9P6XJ62_RHIOR|nr:hypothetical protein G6F23_009212 [Rhizopus arrhizus]KAG1411527.1 hypothetical protein G6F58_008508 [Rhizopus delemar]KAG0768405.1 hypothetical protein G6F24_001970 [Rhizopus arrhizus]KAG0778574.1 hypothetical protein G6F22_011156 [Rhizopus arrhizus]KAG0789668.1 hypothetical protein G6F21_006355 [Rhizopus arrhizus]